MAAGHKLQVVTRSDQLVQSDLVENMAPKYLNQATCDRIQLSIISNIPSAFPSPSLSDSSYRESLFYRVCGQLPAGD